MSHEELIAKMRHRVDQCRRLALGIDPKTAAILNQMADDGEADIERLLSSQPPGLNDDS